MTLPTEPVTLSPPQVQELSQRLSRLRHDVNNRLALVVAAAEILQHKPELTAKMLPTMLREPQQVADRLQDFCDAFDRALGISRQSAVG